MDRRRFAALVAGTVAATPNVVTAQSVELNDCHYLSTMGTIIKMMIATDKPASISDSNQDFGFGLLQMIAVGVAGYRVLNELEPLPGLETSHRLLLESLETFAGAEDDVKEWIMNSDADALTRGSDSVVRAMDLLVQARIAVPPDPLALGSSAQTDSERPTRTPVAGASETSPPPRATVVPTTSGVTLANFNRLREGMSYQEVVSILGSRGELVSSSDLAGIRTEMYQWEGVGSLGANMNAMFQNGRLISKAQFGLE